MHYRSSGGESSDAKPRSTSQFSVFSFLDAESYNRALKPRASPVCNEPVSDILGPSDSTEVITKREPGSESNRCDEMVCSEQKSEDSLLEFPDPPAKIDLYKAIFLSSSEDSDSDSEENNSANLTKESITKEMTSSETKETEGVLEGVPQGRQEVEDKETALSDKIVISAERKSHRNTSPPRGVFANLDLDALNTRKEKSNTVLENKEESDDSEIKEPPNEDHGECEQNNKLEQTEENMYGPWLPSVPMAVIKNTSVPTVKTVLPSVVGSVHTEWVEKVKTVSHKSKHNKKHKKSSKHKKHKHKKKRH
jgi:G patch domain-containing protein 1